MSDNPNDPNNQNDPNDDEEKKDDYFNRKEAIPDLVKEDPLLGSKHFLRNSELIFGYIDEIYNINQKAFISERFSIYSQFHHRFQPGKSLPADINAAADIQSAVAKILSAYGNEENETVLRGKKYEQEVYGLLYIELQSQDRKIIYNTTNFHNLIQQEKINIFDYYDANIYFSTASRQTYGQRLRLRNAGRIIIHLSISPSDFWKSDMALRLIGKLIDFSFITAIKVRNTANFDRADTLLIYTTIEPEKAWSQIRNIVTEIIPEKYRSKYLLPFSAPLDVGINANIPIDYFAGPAGSVITASFTEGLGILGRWAYIWLLTINAPYLDDKLSIFQGILAAIFNKNKLVVTKDGVLLQPERLKAK